MNAETMLAIFAIVVALGVVGVIAVESISIAQQQAQAKQPPGRGCEFTPGGNASKTRCVH
jgi:hypothetical protein